MSARVLLRFTTITNAWSHFNANCASIISRHSNNSIRIFQGIFQLINMPRKKLVSNDEPLITRPQRNMVINCFNVCVCVCVMLLLIACFKLYRELKKYSIRPIIIYQNGEINLWKLWEKKKIKMSKPKIRWHLIVRPTTPYLPLLYLHHKIALCALRMIYINRIVVPCAWKPYPIND